MKLVGVLVCLVILLIVKASKEKNYFPEKSTKFASVSPKASQRSIRIQDRFSPEKVEKPKIWVKKNKIWINNEYSRRISESTASSEIDKYGDASGFNLKNYEQDVREIFEWGESNTEEYLKFVTYEIENFYRRSRLKTHEWNGRKIQLRSIEIAIVNDIWHHFEKDIHAAHKRMSPFFLKFERPPFKIVTKFIPYGSFVSGLYDTKSDSDLSFYVDVENHFDMLKIDKAQIKNEFLVMKKRFLNLQTSQNLLGILTSPGSELLKIAKKNGYEAKFITDSKTRLIKLSNKKYSFDISITKSGAENKMPSNNISRWLNFYLNAYDTKDESYRKFIVGIKRWARMNNLLDSQKYMGAFGYYLLCLKFLKDINALPAAIPKDFSMFTGFAAYAPDLNGKRLILKIHEDDYKITLEGNKFEGSQVRRDSQVKITRRTDWRGRDDESPGKLTQHFFDYYCSKFNNYGQVFISLDPKEKLKFQSSIFHVCDPMDSSNNVAKKMSTENFNELKAKFKTEQIKFLKEKYSFF